MEQNYTYILLCADNTLYTGWTTNLKKRLASHNAGTGAKYTRPRRPVHLVYCEVFDSKTEISVSLFEDKFRISNPVLLSGVSQLSIALNERSSV